MLKLAHDPELSRLAFGPPWDFERACFEMLLYDFSRGIRSTVTEWTARGPIHHRQHGPIRQRKGER